MGTVTQNRRYPRATIQAPAVMTVKVPGTPIARKVAVSIKSISPEGLGLSLAGERFPVETKAMVTMDFHIDSKHFEIPGLVAWVASPSAKGDMDLGIRFQLAMVPNAVRTAYAQWIVDFLRKQMPIPGNA